MRRIWSILLALLILAAPVRAAEDEKWVALTFDDGPSGALTERLLDGLAARCQGDVFCLRIPRGGVSCGAAADRRGGPRDRSAQRKT